MWHNVMFFTFFSLLLHILISVFTRIIFCTWSTFWLVSLPESDSVTWLRTHTSSTLLVCMFGKTLLLHQVHYKLGKVGANNPKYGDVKVPIVNSSGVGLGNYTHSAESVWCKRITSNKSHLWGVHRLPDTSCIHISKNCLRLWTVLNIMLNPLFKLFFKQTFRSCAYHDPRANNQD